MSRTIGQLGGIALGLIVAASAQAQSLIMIPQQPSPGLLRMGDLWNLTIVNPGSTTQSAFLRVQVRSASGELEFEARTGIRDFVAGSRVLGSRDLEPIEVLHTGPGVEAALSRSGSFPDGSYVVCLEPLDPNGVPAGIAACIDVRVATVMPPLPILPPNEGETSQPFIVWTWFMQPASASGEPVACDLRVAEILPGQTPEEALRRNPPVLLRERLRASAWQTNEATRALRSGQVYAWRLTARVNERVASESEIWTFTYRSPELLETGPRGSSPMGAAFTSDSGKAVPAATPAMPARSKPTAQPAITDSAATGSGTRRAQASPAGTRSEPHTVEWHAVARTTVETSNHRGILSRMPARYVRLEVDPTISLYGSPLELALLFTTDRGTQESRFERGTLGLDGRGLELQQRIDGRVRALEKSRTEMLADSARLVREDLPRVESELQQLYRLQRQEPSQATQELERLGLISAAEGTVLRIPRFGFGSVVPDYGRLFLSRVTVDGGMVEHNPGRFYMALTVGKLTREGNGLLTPPVISPDGTPAELAQDLYAARFGLGRKSGNNLIFSGLYARDDRQSRAILGLADPSRTVATQENVVIGLAGRTRRRSGVIVLDGNVQASVFSDDRGAPDVRNRPAPAFLRSFFGGLIRESSAADWSGELRGALNFVHTRIVSGVRFVGPGYITVGARGLRRDNLQYDGSWEQSWREGRVSLGSLWTIDRTGVVLPQSGISNATRLSLRAAVHPVRFPTVEVSISRNGQDQRAGGDDREIENRSNLFSIRVNQAGCVGVTRYMTIILADRLVDTSNDISGSHQSTSASAIEMVSLPSRLGLMARASHSETRTALDDGRDPDVWSGETSLNWAPSPRLDGSAGATWAKSDGLRQMGSFFAARITLGQLGALNMQWSYNDARAIIPGVRGFADCIFRVQFLTRGQPGAVADGSSK